MVYIHKLTKVQRTHGTSDGNGDYCKVRFMCFFLIPGKGDPQETMSLIFLLRIVQCVWVSPNDLS